MKLKAKLDIVLRRLRLGHLVLALTAIPLAASALMLLRNDVPMFAFNLGVTVCLCLILVYVEALDMKKKGLLG